MPKTSISVTLEESTIRNLRVLAEEEMRSVSNLIDYIVAQYAKSHGLSAESRLNQAIEFTEKIELKDYPETQKQLLKHVNIDDEDREFLSRGGTSAI